MIAFMLPFVGWVERLRDPTLGPCRAAGEVGSREDLDPTYALLARVDE
jgi:hypothetical protein